MLGFKNKKKSLIVQERKTKHTLMYLTCEQMMFGTYNSKEIIMSDSPRNNGA